MSAADDRLVLSAVVALPPEPDPDDILLIGLQGLLLRVELDERSNGRTFNRLAVVEVQYRGVWEHLINLFTEVSVFSLILLKDCVLSIIVSLMMSVEKLWCLIVVVLISLEEVVEPAVESEGSPVAELD